MILNRSKVGKYCLNSPMVTVSGVRFVGINLLLLPTCINLDADQNKVEQIIGYDICYGTAFVKADETSAKNTVIISLKQ